MRSSMRALLFASLVLSVAFSALANPSARFGHTTLALPNGDQLVYGGYNYERVDLDAEQKQFVGLQGDIWRYRLNESRWEQIVVDSSSSDGLPPARMLHTAVLHSVVEDNVTKTRMVIHGGVHFARYNGDWSTIYRACGHDDLWAFDLESRAWTLLQEEAADICSTGATIASGLFLALFPLLLFASLLA